MAASKSGSSKSGSDYFPHQGAAKPSDLLKIRRRERREHYELPHDLPHGMLTMLRKLSDGGGSSSLRTRADKYRALAEGA
jgi:hypothetical protein